MAPPPRPVHDRRFSIIIPVLGEQEHIHACLKRLEAQGFADSRQIIVVDGDPEGGTINLIRNGDVLCLRSAPGRALQMNAGAAVAEGRILLFLHADTALPQGALEKISHIMTAREYVGGAFDLAIDSDSLFLRYIARPVSARVSIASLTETRRSLLIASILKVWGDSRKFPSWRTWTSCVASKRTAGRSISFAIAS